MPVDPSNEYERKLERLIKLYGKRVQKIYYDAIIQITSFSAMYAGTGFPVTALLDNTIFDLFPALKPVLEDLAKQMHDGIYTETVNSINKAWELSNDKNDVIAKSIFRKMKLAEAVAERVFNPNADALRKFIKRTEKGMNLSDRVWRLVDPYKYELEVGLADGIGKGRSAAEMARDLKRNLQNPDKLFRRVRVEGKLKLSRAAQNYHPGTGVYRSSYANAFRLTANETNVAYKSADHERWRDADYIKAIQVRVSNNHHVYDECNNLAGTYPQDFKFTAWHVRCRCVATPVLVSDEEFNEQQEFYLGLTKKEPVIERVDKIPEKAAKWIQDNAKRIKGWKNTPNFIVDNKKYVKPFLNKK